MFKHLSTSFILFLLVSSVDSRRGSSGGGFRGSSRGSSASRGHVSSGGSSGGFRPSSGTSNTGFNQPRTNTGFNQPRTNTNFNQPRVNSQPHFNTGSGVGSRGSSHTFAKALAGGAAGALGGILIYQAGKAIIQSATTPYHHNGHSYYFDNNYQGNPNLIQCSMPLSTLQAQVAAVEASTTTTTTVAPVTVADGENTTAAAVETTTPTLTNTLNTLQFQDGTRPKTITWGCKKGIEVCCGSDCCPAPASNIGNAGQNNGGSSLAGVLVAIFIFILIAGCCCCCIAFALCRSAFDCILPRDNNKYEEGGQDGSYPMQQYEQQQGGYPQQQGGYPPQQGGYPPQHGGYPPQQGQGYSYPNQQQQYPNAYPPQPNY